MRLRHKKAAISRAGGKNTTKRILLVASDIDLLYIFIGGFVIWIFIFKRELLIDEKSFRVILGISVALFIVGIMLHFTEAGRYSASGALLSPPVSLGLFRLCRKVFLRKFNREPKDTFLNWDAGLAADRVFNIVYGTLASLLGMIIAGGMLQLAKAGW